MPTEYITDTLRAAYEDEWERIHRLDAMTPFYGAVIAGLAGASLYYIQNMSDMRVNFLFVVFVILLITSIIALASAVYYLVRSFCWHKYGIPASADDIASFVQNSRQHYESLGETPVHVQEHIDRDTREMMIEQYRLASNTNRTTYLLRWKYMHKAHIGMVASIIALFLTMFPYLGVFERKHQKIELIGGTPAQKIEINGVLQLQQPPAVAPNKGEN